MKLALAVLLLLILPSSIFSQTREPNLTRLVDPFVGTGGPYISRGNVAIWDGATQSGYAANRLGRLFRLSLFRSRHLRFQSYASERHGYF